MDRVIVASSALEMEAFKSAWHALQRTGKYTIFQSFEWNQLAAWIFAAREVPRVVFAETEGGMAIVPAAIAQQNLTLLGEELFDYRDVLAIGDTRALSLAWMAVAEIADKRGLDFKVKGVRGSSFGFGLNSRREFESGFFANAPAVRRCDSGMKSHFRLARNLQRLVGSGCTLKVCQGDDSPLVRKIVELKAGQDKANLFHDPLRIEMACAMARTCGAGCEIFMLLNGATIVAALVTFVDQNIRRFYTIYYNRLWAKYSPGIALMHHVVQSSLASGMNVDLMTGEQPYKQRFATFNEPLYTLRATPAMLLESGSSVLQCESQSESESRQPSLVG